MKKFLLCALYGAFALGALTMTSCSKDDGGKKDDDTVYNEFLVAGQLYTTTNGYTEYYGNVNEAADGIYLAIINPGDYVGLDFEIAVPAGTTRLPAGTYTFTDAENEEDVEPFSFQGEVWNDSLDVNIVEGELTVSVSGSGDNAVYTIDVNCVLEGGETATGIYRGKLTYYDGTFEGEGSGEFNVNGEAFQATGGGMENYGDYYNDRTTNIGLEIYSDDVEIVVDMIVPASNDRLVAHTYNYSDVADVTAYTFGNWDDYSYVQVFGGDEIDIVDGTIEVSVSGTGYEAVYTITFDCTLENGQPLEGTYTGTLGLS